MYAAIHNPNHGKTGRGFTLVELLVVIAIIGILIALEPPDVPLIEPPACFPHCGEEMASARSAAPDGNASARTRAWTLETSRTLSRLQPLANDAERTLKQAKASGGTVEIGYLRRLQAWLKQAERDIGTRLSILRALHASDDDWRHAETEKLEKLQEKLGLAAQLTEQALRERQQPAPAMAPRRDQRIRRHADGMNQN